MERYIAFLALALVGCLPYDDKFNDAVNNNGNIVTVGNTDGGSGPKPDLTDPVNPNPDLTDPANNPDQTPQVCTVPDWIGNIEWTCDAGSTPFKCIFGTTTIKDSCAIDCPSHFSCKVADIVKVSNREFTWWKYTCRF